MPAPLINASEIYNMSPSRWGVPLKVLTNKRAADAAFQQHMFEMQKQAAALASGEKNVDTQGQYRLDEQKRQNEAIKGPDYQAKLYTAQYVKDKLLDLNDPAAQEEVQKVYQYYLDLFSGNYKGAVQPDAAGAQNLAAGVAPKKPFEFPGAMGDYQEKATGSRGWAKIGPSGRVEKSTPGSEVTAINRATGQKLVLRNGKWQPR